ncbi:MAG: SoxR reducing system RseC family protein [Deltaproteobacteria bacterium]|nr:SoxR reducing system RseC family protein [Deltaproteobacteria bacterium]MBW2041274.1 SoxR reducing system RseC family protein [Deltaproteobacteria bacterium]MBW2131252.1 SoxR reducing system RseC family protein [Deltaproteobacteria bacterium]
MTTEEGIVIDIRGETARVKTQKTGACESCSARTSCHAIGGGKEMEVDALNTVGARIGDRVVMGFETASLVKASFLLYVLPILCMIAGGFLGEEAAGIFGLNPAFLSVLTAFLFLGLSFVFIRIKGNRMGRTESYRPKIIRVVKCT